MSPGAGLEEAARARRENEGEHSLPRAPRCRAGSLLQRSVYQTQDVPGWGGPRRVYVSHVFHRASHRARRSDIHHWELPAVRCAPSMQPLPSSASLANLFERGWGHTGEHQRRRFRWSSGFSMGPLLYRNRRPVPADLHVVERSAGLNCGWVLRGVDTLTPKPAI